MIHIDLCVDLGAAGGPHAGRPAYYLLITTDPLPVSSMLPPQAHGAHVCTHACVHVGIHVGTHACTCRRPRATPRWDERTRNGSGRGATSVYSYGPYGYGAGTRERGNDVQICWHTSMCADMCAGMCGDMCVGMYVGIYLLQRGLHRTCEGVAAYPLLLSMR